MSDYATTVSAIAQQAKAYEDSLPLRNEACRSRFFFQPHPTERVCLFLHGFTAGPYQFVPMGEAFFAAGYNVLIPLMPGHGQAASSLSGSLRRRGAACRQTSELGKRGDWNSDNPPPLPTDPEIYQQFVWQWLQQAQTLGKQVVVGGLSSGATLAAWLALEHPQQIYRTLLFAPYLSSSIKLVDFFVEILPFYFEWLNKDAPGNFGYDGFRIPALRLFLDMGQEILERSPNSLSAPMFIVSSESDVVTNSYDHQVLFESVLKHQPKSWYHCLDKALDIHHRMLTKVEGNDFESLLITLARAYVVSDLTWAEVLEIGDQILQGKTFDAVVAELNLTHKVSPELSVMISILDKKTIVNARTSRKL